MDYRRPHIHGIVLHLLWPLKVRSDPCILSRRSNLSGYFVTAPNLIRHGSRVSPDYHFNSIASDLRPYLDARHYTLVIGHSLGAAAVLSLFPHLPALYPTAIVLVDPPMQQGPDKLDFLDDMFTEFCVNIKPAEDYTAENPLWTREDTIYRELGTRLCSVDAVHGILRVRYLVPDGRVLIRIDFFLTAKPTMVLFRFLQRSTRQVESDSRGRRSSDQ